MTALKESSRLEMERAKNMALAVRAGFSDQKAFQEFLSGHSD